MRRSESRGTVERGVAGERGVAVDRGVEGERGVAVDCGVAVERGVAVEGGAVECKVAGQPLHSAVTG